MAGAASANGVNISIIGEGGDNGSAAWRSSENQSTSGAYPRRNARSVARVNAAWRVGKISSQRAARQRIYRGEASSANRGV